MGNKIQLEIISRFVIYEMRIMNQYSRYIEFFSNR